MTETILYFLNDLKNCNESFWKDVTYNNIKSHTKPSLQHLSQKPEERGFILTRTLVLLRFNTKFCIIRLRSLRHLRRIEKTNVRKKQQSKWQLQMIDCLHCQRIMSLHYFHQKIFQEEMVISKKLNLFHQTLVFLPPEKPGLYKSSSLFSSYFNIMSFQSIAANYIPL